MLAIATTVIGSVIAAVALVWAFVMLMARVIDFLDANYGALRDDGRRPSPAGRRQRRAGRTGDGDRDPAWWPRFERQFADYVERLG
jgi:hypothetical protein